MPARSNDFQRIVKYIYNQISDEAKVSESGVLRERDGTAREVDILIEWQFASTDLKMAIECRDHSRQQDIQWVDELIGKYVDLKIDKRIAISSSKFSMPATRKANAHGIDIITVNEALTKDWRAAIERWRFMTHSFTLIRIGTLKPNGESFTYSEIAADGKTATHRDQISEHMYNVLHPFFMQYLSQQVASQLEAMIAERWQQLIDDPTPRYAEVEVRNPGLMRDGEPLDIEKIVFGVATFFHIGSPNTHFALREYSLSDITIETMQAASKLRLVFDTDAKPISIDFGDGKIIRPPRPTQNQP